MVFVIDAAALGLAVAGMTVWRIGRVVPWRSLLAIASATHSPRACLAFIRYCDRG